MNQTTYQNNSKNDPKNMQKVLQTSVPKMIKQVSTNDPKSDFKSQHYWNIGTSTFGPHFRSVLDPILDFILDLNFDFVPYLGPSFWIDLDPPHLTK